MEFGVGFVLLLVVVGGFAAYQGDKVGMIVGRRRLSILGLRPRYTSRIITIFTGVTIVLFTLVSLIVLSDSVRQALFGVDRLKQAVEVLSVEVGIKNEELVSLAAQRQELAKAIADLKKENEHLQAQNIDLRSQQDALSKQTAQLMAERSRLESDRTFLVTQLGELRKAGEYYFDQVSRLQQANFNLRQANFVYHALDVLASRVVDARQPAAELRLQLRDLLHEANDAVLRNGAGDIASRTGVRIDRVIAEAQDRYTLVDTDLVIDLAVKAIQSDTSLESVIVQLVAITNAAAGEPVQADFSLIRNLRLFDAGEVVARRVLDGRNKRGDLFEEFVLWIQSDVREEARSRGLMPQDDGTYGGVSPTQAYEVVDRVAAHGALVEVIAYSAQECWTRGPLALGFRLQPLAR